MSDRLLRAYARLKAFEISCQSLLRSRDYVIEYHEILDQVQTTELMWKNFAFSFNN